jgi:membrane-bound serine protease (ClpP class)
MSVFRFLLVPAWLCLASLATALHAQDPGGADPAPEAAPEAEPATMEAEPATMEAEPSTMEAEPRPEAEEGTWDIPPTLDLKSLREGEGIPKVFVVPINGQISDPQLFILRRSLKMAIERGVNTIVLDLDTPGGSVNTTIKIMEAMDRFNGDVLAYVNDEAISAGAYIASASDYIFMTSKGVIGAAEVVMGTGEDVPESMKRKIESYIQAKVRTLASKYRYRGDVIRAMSDPDFVLEIDGEVLKPAGELLTLTGEEAVRAYGDPPENLLAYGLFDDVDALLDGLYGESQYELVDFEITWSEELAKYLAAISPALLGLRRLPIDPDRCFFSI